MYPGFPLLEGDENHDPFAGPVELEHEVPEIRLYDTLNVRVRKIELLEDEIDLLPVE